MLTVKKPVVAVFLGPALLCYALVFLYPTFRTTIMSFFAVESVSDPVRKWAFTGFANYKKLFTTPVFLQSLKNIGRIWFCGGIGVMALALLFAVILTSGSTGQKNGRSAGRTTKFFRSVIYLPNVVSAIAMGTMWINYVYNPNYGLLHSIFAGLGFKAAAATLWTSPGILFWSMLAAYCFGMVGYHMLIFISGIEQIPRDYYEAALLEGATIFQRFVYVTIPNMRGVLRTNLVMWTVFTVGFFVWGQLFSPVNLSNDTVAPMNYMYELVFGASSAANTARDTGAGAAIGVILMMMVIAVFYASTFIVKNDDAEV
ncbi:MAG: sugar ABC transporter permease [Spirochaetaceae bacterium]|jgi:multiple sugar transport system permease protein|nr:sugar ABC transporter permease [Spirochaetaceae bacterium]